MNELHVPVRRLPTGEFEKGHNRCAVCKAAVGPDPDEERAAAGIVRCENGHIDMSSTVNVVVLEI